MVIRHVFVAMVLVGTAVFSLAGCNHDDTLTANPTAGPTPNTGQEEKPDPAKVVEKKRGLVLQKPTLTESEFTNVMQLVFGDAEKASFAFTYAPDKTGSLFFTNAQSKLSLEECTESTKRKLKYNIFWQEDTGTTRTNLKAYTPDITEYPFVAGKKYLLRFVLLDLKGEAADCKSATLKFAVFAQNYNTFESLKAEPVETTEDASRTTLTDNILVAE